MEWVAGAGVCAGGQKSYLVVGCGLRAVWAELVEVVFPSCVWGLATSRGLPGGNLLSFCVAKKKVSKEKGDPMVWVPCAALRGNLRCSTPAGVGRTRLAPRTTAALIPPPSALLGPARRVGKKAGADADTGRHDARGASCRTQQTVMFARGCSTRGQMKLPAIAQRGEGGAGRGRGGAREWGVAPTVYSGPTAQRDAGLTSIHKPPAQGWQIIPPHVRRFRQTLSFPARRPDVSGL